MVVIFYGTSAELIKMLGITKLIPRSEQFLICTAQHNEGLEKLHPQLNIEPDLYLARGWKGKDIANIKQMLGLMLKAHGTFARQFRSIKKTIRSHDKQHGTKSVALVHGDTLTTLVGAYLAKFLGLRVGHVEAGLRSGKWNNPFPEEMDRRIAAKIARIHFSPNDRAVENLKAERTKGDIVNTQFNTSKDSVDMSENYLSERFASLQLPKHYGLVLLHRTELLEKKEDFEAILKLLNAHASAKTPLVFTGHTTTLEKLKIYGFDHYLDKPSIHIIPKQNYFDYMQIVKQADYIITDSGGLQEDAYFFGVPIMIHRRTTERYEGIGLNAQISHLDIAKVAAFLQHLPNKAEFQKLQQSFSPSAVVVDYLREHHYITNKAV
jgi:UDP-N-acetylglucosamine 2-epimerase (non-hydrolysing)